MKKVTAFIGSARRKTTYEAIKAFESGLKKQGEIEFEYVFLSDYNLEFCKGCKMCFDKGEAHCPINDDRDLLIEKINASDGIIFATPNYAFHVSATMKNFIDRIAYVFHRPRFFGKTFTGVVTQGIFGGRKILKYLENTGSNLGFVTVKGCLVNTLEPMSEAQEKKMRETVEKASRRFYDALVGNHYPSPSFFRLMIFRMTRTGLKYAKVKLYDYQYYKEKGWLESDYFYETTLGPVKKISGRLFDFMGRKMAGNQ